MRLVAIFVAFATALVAASVSAVIRSDEAVLASRSGVQRPEVFNVAADPVLRRGCAFLLARARFGLSRVEYAAFVVRGPDGRLSLVEWSGGKKSDEAAWKGPFPLGTVGIVHTHPNWVADPSPVDVETARTRHVPVYVVTRTRITVTDGQATVVVADDWIPDKR